jgi:hypothetical protein
MEQILTPADKKYLKFFVKYLQSYGEKTGTFRIEDFDNSSYYSDNEIGNQLHLEENYYLDVPHEIAPILDKILKYCVKNIPTPDEEISSTSLEIMIDADGSIGAEYCYRFYTVDDQYKTFDAGDDSLSQVFDDLDEADYTGNVYVSFDGNGDSGQIEQAEDGSGNIVNLSSTMEDWCYNILENYYGGWEINEGSSGKFIFNTEERTCELEFGWNNENTECDTLYEEKFDN